MQRMAAEPLPPFCTGVQWRLGARGRCCLSALQDGALCYRRLGTALRKTRLREGAGVGLVLLSSHVGAPGRLAAGARDPQAALRVSREDAPCGLATACHSTSGQHSSTCTPCTATGIPSPARPALAPPYQLRPVHVILSGDGQLASPGVLIMPSHPPAGGRVGMRGAA